MQWDRVENKGSVVVYAGGALVLLWFSSTIVSAVNAVPLVQASFTCSECSLCSDFHHASCWQQHSTRCTFHFGIEFADIGFIRSAVMAALPAIHVYPQYGERH